MAHVFPRVDSLFIWLTKNAPNQLLFLRNVIREMGSKLTTLKVWLSSRTGGPAAVTELDYLRTFELINQKLLPNLGHLTLCMQHDADDTPTVLLTKELKMPILGQLEECNLVLPIVKMDKLMPSIEQYAQHNPRWRSLALKVYQLQPELFLNLNTDFTNKISHLADPRRHFQLPMIGVDQSLLLAQKFTHLRQLAIHTVVNHDVMTYHGLIQQLAPLTSLRSLHIGMYILYEGCPTSLRLLRHALY